MQILLINLYYVFADMSTNIPKDFYSDSDEKPFRECKVCKQDLTDGKTPYSIEKAYKKTTEGEDLTLFELAICIPCAQKQGEKMSKESRKFIEQTMMTERFFNRRNELWKNGWEEHWNKECIFSGKTLSNNEEYHVVGHFQGDEVLKGQPPFVIGPEMISYIQENLSPETKEEMDDFGGQFLGPDPKIAELLEDYQFVMV